MALQISGMPRKFVMQMGGVGERVELDDINPNYSPDRVRELYAMTYPALTNATIEGPKMGREHVEYVFAGTVGTKG